MIQSQSSIVNAIFDPKLRYLWHILFWIVMYLDPFFALVGLTPPIDFPIVLFLGFAIDVFLVYFNIYVLIPNLLFKEKIFLYIFFTIISLGVILLFNNVSDSIICPECAEEIAEEDKRYLVVYTLLELVQNAAMIAIAAAIKLFKFIYQKDRRIQEINEEKLKTELGFLKNQVNPHFLFNTMNSFYIQAKKKDNNLPEAILSLSDLLRYQIYDTSKEFVSLESEINYIRNYLDLENNRRDNLDIKLKIDGNLKSVKIAPLLLLPLVENAVKYSQKTDGSRAIININVEVDDRISFAISNTKGNVDQIKSPDSGIGMENLEKRLNLIYPDDYSFAFKDVDKIYTASLILGKR